jgi:predicted nucleic acid-binding protein
MDPLMDELAGRPVVLDTNVVVAAGFNPRSRAARVVAEIERGTRRMVWNDETRREIEHIVHKIPPLRRMTLAPLFRDADRYTGQTRPGDFSYVPDPDDRKFAALAAAAGAVLLTVDEHLLAARDRASVPILTPAEYIARTRADSA